MEPELFSDIESALWRNLMVLSNNKDSSCEYLRGYFCACEDLAFIFSRLERCLDGSQTSFRSERKRLSQVIKNLRDHKYF